MLSKAEYKFIKKALQTYCYEKTALIKKVDAIISNYEILQDARQIFLAENIKRKAMKIAKVLLEDKRGKQKN